jgi:thiamine pyrophosphokinase
MTIPEAADRLDARSGHAIVVADGDVAAREVLDAAWPGWADDASVVIAADGGYARALGLGLAPSMLVGDLDSVDPALAEAAEAGGVVVRRVARDKDESDAELALLAAVEAGVRRITVLGAFGGRRLDHALANLWLLAHPALAATPVVLLDARARVSLLTAPGPDGAHVTRPLPGALGGLVTLLPFAGDATGVTTHGLRYPLRDEPLRTGPARGLSNVRVLADAAVTLRAGRLLVVETPVGAVATPAGLSSEP